MSTDHFERLRGQPLITVEPWPDALVERFGFPLRHPYVEGTMTGIVGPTALLMLRLLDRGLAESPEGFTLDVADIAAALGVGAAGRNSPFWRSLGRLVDFDVVTPRPTGVAVRRALAPLSEHRAGRLPASALRIHQAEVRRLADAGLSQAS
jgi:hypothetical protein